MSDKDKWRNPDWPKKDPKSKPFYEFEYEGNPIPEEGHEFLHRIEEPTMRLFFKRLKRYGVNHLIALDQWGNVLWGGDPDETISSRLGRIQRRHGGAIPWRRPIPKLINWCLNKIDPNHSIDAIEHDEPLRRSWKAPIV